MLKIDLYILRPWKLVQCQSITLDDDGNDDDGDDDDDDDELMNYICGMVDLRKTFTPYYQPRPLSEILTIANLRHPASRVWTYTDSAFRLVKWSCAVVIITTSTEIKSIMISQLETLWWTWWHHKKNLRKSKKSKKIYENLQKLIKIYWQNNLF